ncbi:class I SAM-dependent methyltransferase [Lacticaseibacillus paracasei]|uniref:class I SAM-dependent methyltransferase n=1 Tax=Lacticaseibacillus paracasei TaxID=1597 RepID=UPI000FF40017|nr:class I SAM-dependent methyltransferase [Lacticaseibacillus paracasei]RND59038.1 Glycine/sarcosine/dimethylglycine N-methyltransferase [Lacticaseibacillus paracasei]
MQTGIGLYLTPTVPVPQAWLGNLSGKRVLGLASGGGQQGPLLTGWGAKVTILDFSANQLAQERAVAEREGYHIKLLQGDMTEPLPFEDASFDLVVHPVANCYVQDVDLVWREAWRVLKPGGKLLAGLDNGMNFIVDPTEQQIVNRLPYDPLHDESQRQQAEAEGAGMQFSHTIVDQIGGQLKAGFQLLDVYEDTNSDGHLAELNIPSFWASRSCKTV